MNDHDSFAAAISKITGLLAIWFASVNLASAQIMVSIVSGLAVGAYSVLKFVSLWRREFSKKG